MAQKIRAFIAVEVAAEVRRRAAELAARLASAAEGVRWVDPRNMHLTLKFLGDVDATEIHRVCQAAAEAVSGAAPFVLEIRGAGAFPNVRRPRTIWVGGGVGSEEAEALAKRLERAMKPLGFRPEGRHYAPHLTLGRVRQPGPWMSRFAELLAEHEDYALGQTPVSEIVVFSSQLDSTGPTYEALGRAALTGPTPAAD